MPDPLFEIQVIIPVFNPILSHFEEALASLNAQTHDQFEVLFIDDGSSPAISTDWISERLNRPFRLLVHETNQGVAAALNTGLDAATAPFLARFDADDRMDPTRFSAQIAFMKAHPEIGVCGTEAVRFGTRKDAFLVAHDHDEIASRILLETPFCHPSVCFRREALKGFRYPDIENEDSIFWATLFEAGVRMANLPEPLVHYRIEGQNISVVSKESRVKRDLANAALKYQALFPGADRSDFLAGVQSHAHVVLGFRYSPRQITRDQLNAHVEHIMHLVRSRPDRFSSPDRVLSYLNEHARIGSSPLRLKWHKFVNRFVRQQPTL